MKRLNKGTERKFIVVWVSWGTGAVLYWVAFYYIGFHELLRIPLRFLSAPVAVECGVSILIAPLAIIAASRFKASGGLEFGLFYLTASLLVLCTELCWIYIGFQSGVLPLRDKWALYTIAVFVSILGPWLAYLLRRQENRTKATQQNAPPKP